MGSRALEGENLATEPAYQADKSAYGRDAAETHRVSGLECQAH